MPLGCKSKSTTGGGVKCDTKSHTAQFCGSIGLDGSLFPGEQCSQHDFTARGVQQSSFTSRIIPRECAGTRIAVQTNQKNVKKMRKRRRMKVRGKVVTNRRGCKSIKESKSSGRTNCFSVEQPHTPGK